MRKPRFVGEAADWWLYLSWRQIFGNLFAIGGVLLTIYAVKVDPKDQLLIAAVAAFYQIVAAPAFSSHDMRTQLTPKYTQWVLRRSWSRHGCPQIVVRQTNTVPQ